MKYNGCCIINNISVFHTVQLKPRLHHLTGLTSISFFRVFVLITLEDTWDSSGFFIGTSSDIPPAKVSWNEASWLMRHYPILFSFDGDKLKRNVTKCSEIYSIENKNKRTTISSKFGSSLWKVFLDFAKIINVLSLYF